MSRFADDIQAGSNPHELVAQATFEVDLIHDAQGHPVDMHIWRQYKDEREYLGLASQLGTDNA